MLTKNLTPFPFGAVVTSRRPPQVEMALVVRGAFRLSPGEAAVALDDPLLQGDLSGERFNDDDDERAGECLYGGDFAHFKLNAEVLLKGTCRAPGGKPVTECPVLFRVGAWSKALRVIGDRTFTEKLIGPAISEPAPFSSMKLSWSNAYGGPGYEQNPAGKGFKTSALPNVELAGDVIRSRSDRPEPAGFGPINPAWPSRAEKRGKEYGRSYQAERAPFFSEDFDWRYFSVAPLDQQLSGYLVGDEEITLQNLHASRPLYTARLPKLRLRAFAKDAAGAFREVKMALDTLFVDMDEERLFLTWRGLSPAGQLDLADIEVALIASEELGAAPLPEAHYKALLDAFELDPTGVKEKLPPGLLEARERLERERAGELPSEAPESDGLDPVSAVLRRRMGRFAAAQQAKISESLKQLQAAAGSRVDLKAEAEKLDRQIADAPPVAISLKPGVAPNIGLRRQMRAVLAQAAEARKSIDGDKISPADRARLLAKIEELERMPRDPSWSKLDPTYTPPVKPLSTDEPGPGKDLSERDLTRADLRGMDLRGANLRDAILTRADLTGANLAGADLTNAILFKTELAGADLSGATLSRANAAYANAEGAVFTTAVLDMTFFDHAKLAGADFGGARGEYTVFSKADLRRARARGISLFRADFSEASLEKADLEGASLASCHFAKCRAAGASLRGAGITKASFEFAILEGATLADCRGERAIFSGAKLDGADMSLAALPSSFFIETSAVGANLFGADLRRCRLDRARLDNAEITRANLFFADLSRAHLNGTSFRGASLYGAAFVGAAGAGADLLDANIKRSTLETA